MLVITLLGVCILFALSIFQLLLIAGTPLGDYAWGGQHKVLPRKLRIASMSSVLLYAVFGIFLVSKSGVVNIIPEGPFLTATMWVLTGYFAVGVLLNAISRNSKERLVMTPTAFLLALIFAVSASS